MMSDEQAKSAFDTLAVHLREEIGQQLQSVVDKLAAAAVADRDRAIADARSQVEREAQERLAADVLLAETRAREEGRDAGYLAGKAEGREAGYAAGKEEGREAGYVAGKEEGREAGYSAGKEEGHEIGHAAGKNEGHEAGFAAGKDAGYAAGKDDGHAAGRDAGYAAGIEAGEKAAAERAAIEKAAADEAAAMKAAADEAAAEEAAAERAVAERVAAEKAAAEKDLAEKAAAEKAAAEQEAAAQRAASRADGDASDAASSRRLLDAIQAIGRAHSLSDILDTLAGCAGGEAARAAVFLVRGDRFRAWKLLGFGPALDEDGSLEFGFDQAGVLAVAARTNGVATGDGEDAAAPPSFAPLAAGQTCMAVPIALGGDVVAVLYADQGTHGVWTAAVEVIARHAARSLEALTAFKAARAIMEQPAAADALASGANGDATDDDASARRYARLLVSEIKLYHEAAVVAGRREGDLGRRLSEEISQARSLYEQRVPPAVRLQADYFNDELVRTLANGDAGLLEARS